MSYENIKENIDGSKSEMSLQQLKFVLRLIEKYKPMKIVEIGVAAGGTSVEIMKCIERMHYKPKFFSLDKSVMHYKDLKKKTGYMILDYMEKRLINVDHTLLTGKYAVEYAEDIGENIDFLILDTVHSLPGELLDFLAFYPYLRKGAVVVLHDIVLNHYGNDVNAFATKILLDTIVGDKLVFFDNQDQFSNIGAFIINEDTDKYIGDVFSALTITWDYKPRDEEILLYRNFYKSHYSSEKLKIFDKTVELNYSTLERKNLIRQEEILKTYKCIEFLKTKNVYIYGSGYFGQQIYGVLSKCGVIIKGYIISDSENKRKLLKDVYFLSEVKFDRENDVIFIGVSLKLQSEICSELQLRNILNYILPDEDILRCMIG